MPYDQLLPTTVIGSHALPGWFWTAMDALKEGQYGPTDEQEVYDDAVRLAIWDQKEAEIDIITDGEMRRWYFVQNFYGRMEGLLERPTLRQAGLYGYDTVPRYWVNDTISVPTGLGIVEEFQFLKENAGDGQQIKACCPGPLTLTMHIQLRDEDPYKDRVALGWKFAESINSELKALEGEGCTEVQLDEPQFRHHPRQADRLGGTAQSCAGRRVNEKKSAYMLRQSWVAPPRQTPIRLDVPRTARD